MQQSIVKFIALSYRHCSTCFGHYNAHQQEPVKLTLQPLVSVWMWRWKCSQPCSVCYSSDWRCTEPQILKTVEYVSYNNAKVKVALTFWRRSLKFALWLLFYPSPAPYNFCHPIPKLFASVHLWISLKITLRWDIPFVLIKSHIW